MDYQDEKNISNREHLEQVWKSTGERPKEYIKPEVPPCGINLYEAFWELRNSTDGTIEWSNIYYYCKCYDIQFTGQDIKLIFRMNDVANKWIKKKIASRNKVNKRTSIAQIKRGRNNK